MSGSGTTSQRKKSWHESKHLRKRAAFLLENLDLIPTDVCFRIITQDEMVEEVHGHKIFFALASPVFHAMFYGPLKEEGDVEIEDISAEAFRCMQKYLYTDSFDGVSSDNVLDVLAASKKYLMAKLTRYCYGFIQNNITAENSVSLWSQARNIFDETVADQCVAEIKRSTTKAVSAESFLNMSQDQLLELTSWQTLTINEFDLFQAVKKWKLFQEGRTTGFSVSCRRKEGGIFQNIRFALFALEQLADKFILDEVFSPDDLKEIFCHKTAAMELTTFSPKIRDPAPPSFQLSIKYFGIDAVGHLKIFGSHEVLIWADVAPKACQILRRYVENHFRFAVELTVGRSTDADRGLARCTGRTEIDGWGPFQLRKLSQEEIAHVEKQSGLWAVPQSALLSFDEDGPRLLISNGMEQPLLGQQPSIKLMEDTTGEQSGIVVGKVLSCSPKLLENCRRQSCVELYFECSIVQTNV